MTTIKKIALILGSYVIVCSANAEVIAVVSANSTVGKLTNEQVTDIYLGKKEFPGGGVALPLITVGGAERDEFLEKIIGKTPAQVRATWSRLVFTGKGTPPKEVADITEMKKTLVSNPSCIGFIDKKALDSSLKAVTP